MAIIGILTKEIFLDKIKNFKFDYCKIEKRNSLRQEFVKTFPIEKIKKLEPENYFPEM